MPLTEQELRKIPLPELLEVAIEEAAELIQAIQKVKIHGLTGTAPDGTEYDNISAAMHEARQVCDAMRIWGGRQGVNWSATKDKVEREGRRQIENGARAERVGE